MKRTYIAAWLRETDEAALRGLWNLADRTRKDTVGEEVHLRGLVEFSNCCARNCCYCGIRKENPEIIRYRMTEDEVLACCHEADGYGYGTVVLQSGEDPAITRQWMTRLIRRIKAETRLAVTLSLGERGPEDLEAWRDDGADRYLLRFETSSPSLYRRIHPPPPGGHSDRIRLLGTLRHLGYEVGSGVMVGIPGQTWDDLANDIHLFRELDLDMIGLGPYIPHPDTPLGRLTLEDRAPEEEQVPNTELMTYKAVALARIVCPAANIPSTTALATLNIQNGRELGLERGANVVMPNLTPPRYRRNYAIYPGKACITETAASCHACLRRRILSLGRTIGSGRGDSANYLRRTRPTAETLVESNR
jgi:biotin synthase